METCVVNCRKERYDVYIGRHKDPILGKWGNPFSHKEDTLAKFKVNTRKESIEAHKKWITEGEGMYLLKDLHELDGKILGCFCKPKSCHGDTLVELIKQQKTNKLF